MEGSNSASNGNALSLSRLFATPLEKELAGVYRRAQLTHTPPFTSLPKEQQVRTPYHGGNGVKTIVADLVTAIRHPQGWSDLASPESGWLFVGMPGVGKSSAARYVYEETGNFHFYTLNSSTVASSYVNGSASIISCIYAMARSKEGGPAIVFIDDLANLVNKDHSADVWGVLLLEIEGVESHTRKWAGIGKAESRWFDAGYVLTIATTSRPWDLPTDLRSRFRVPLLFDVYNEIELTTYFTQHLLLRAAGRVIDLKQKEIKCLVKLFKGFTNRDLESIMAEAGKNAQKRQDNQDERGPIRFADIITARCAKPTCRPVDWRLQKRYAKFLEKY